MTKQTETRHLSEYHDAQLAGDRHRAMDVVLAALEGGATTMDVYTDIIEPAQYDVGRKWASGALSVAGEHAATAITQHVVSALQMRHGHHAPTRGRITVTGVAGEAHQVGSQIVADALEQDGWDVRYLGTDAPEPDVVDAIATFAPEVVCISATLIENIEAVTSLIAGIRSSGSAARIIVGGGAFSAWDDLWMRCGADAVAGDVRQAMVVVRG